MAEIRYRDGSGTQDEPANRPIRRKTGLSELMPDSHKRAAKLLGYALTLGDGATWEAASAIWAARLSKVERAGILFAALRALDPADAFEVVETVLGARAPLPPFLGGMADARFWASLASPAELKAHALAAFEAMPPKDQAAFFHHITKIEVAA